MAYTGVTKQQILDAMWDAIEELGYPDNEELLEDQAEECIFTAYEEACKVVNPDKEYPPVRN